MPHVAHARPARVRRRVRKPPVARPSARPDGGHRTGPTRPERQRGVALVVALVLLVATSVLAIATLSGTRLGERQASNAQFKAIAFEVAESGIGAALADGDAMRAALRGAPGNEPPAVHLTGLETALGASYDQLAVGDGAGLDFDGELTAQYCGSRMPIGSELSAEIDTGVPVDLVYDVRATVTTGGVAARADHVQRVARLGLGGARTGRCPVPWTLGEPPR